MTQEQKRIKIAEECGLFRILPLKRTTRKGKDDPNGVVLWYCSEHMGGAATYDKLPDYFNNLNAMHEAEKLLTSSQWVSYWSFLEPLTCRPHNASILHATAAQRAEAFGHTLNLW